MLEEKTGVGPGLLFMVLYVTMFGYGELLTPYVAARTIGNNGYWGLLLAFILAIGFIVLLNSLGKMFPGKSVIQYLPDLCGTALGKLLGVIYLLLILTTIVFTSSLIIQQWRAYFLIRTPGWAMALLFLGISAFIAYQGIEGITRLAAFAFPVTFFLTVVAIAFSFQNFELDNIRPIFFIDGLKIPMGAVQLFYPFTPLVAVLLIYPYLTKKEKGLKMMMGAASLAFGLIFVTIVSSIGNYSAPGLLRYAWPAIELTRKANLPYVLQTFGLFFTVSWLTVVLIGTGLLLYVVAEGTSQLVNTLNYKWFTLILFPVVLFAVILPSEGIELRHIFTNYHLVSFALTLGLPIFLWLLALIRRRGLRRDAA